MEVPSTTPNASDKEIQRNNIIILTLLKYEVELRDTLSFCHVILINNKFSYNLLITTDEILNKRNKMLVEHG